MAALAALKKARRDVCKGAGPASGAAVAIDENVPPATAAGGVAGDGTDLAIDENVPPATAAGGVAGDGTPASTQAVPAATPSGEGDGAER